jgi:SecD/SecF fusion protein
MQGKSLGRALLILVAIICLYQFLYFIPTRKVEKNADEYAEEVASSAGENVDKAAIYKIARAGYLDSMSSEVVFKIPLLKEYTYSELKSQQLNFGLDLKGGMSVVLQVDLEELLNTLAGPNKKDPVFLQAIENTNKALEDSQSDYVSLFVDEFRNIANGKSLASIFMRSELLDDINVSSSDGEVERRLREKANETVGLTFEMLKERIDRLGVTQPNVSLDPARDLILVELPGIDNPERARENLQASAELQFWDTYRTSDAGILAAVQEADARLAAISGEGAIQDTIVETLYDSEGNPRGDTTIIKGSDDLFNQGGPLLSKLALNQGTLQPTVIGTAEKNKMNVISEMLAQPEIKSLFPKNSKFLWSRNARIDYQTGEKTNEFELYMIKTLSGTEKAPLEGDVVTDARYQPDPVTNEPTVSLTMDKRGAKIWADLTTKAYNNGGREIAIVLDQRVVSAPGVNNGPITEGRSSISGNYTVQEATDFANILEVGKLPARTTIIQSTTVGPSLGAENISRSIKSLLAGFLLVLVFMILYYGGAGIVAITALFANLLFIFGALSSIGTVLTLPGIAGIVLTIGMAVDANVIIFERVREELRAGKTLLASIADGFMASYSAIIDANVTTLLTAFVLAYFGLGPIKGFAVVLIIGVISSLLTAVLFGKLMIDGWVSKDKNITFWTGWSKNMLADLNIDWIGKRKIAYIASSVIIVAGLISMFTKGFDLGVDFKGGHSYTIQFPESSSIKVTDIKQGLTSYLEDEPSVKTVDTDNTFHVVTSYKIDDNSEEADEEVLRKVHEGINVLVGGAITYEQFKNPETSDDIVHVISTSKVGPTIADDIKKSSFYAGSFALLLIFLYIFIRFSKWQYSLGAVTALAHDSLIVLGIFSLFSGILPFSLEIDQAFIAAILTVIGYSINDTVVVFDRIREYLGIYTNKSKDEVLNLAINSTFSRTIITSLTTLFVVAILFFFGGTSLKGMAFALLVGILVGTYSSIFVATPILRDFSDELKTKKAAQPKRFSRAAAKA